MPLKTSSFSKGIFISNLKRYWLIGFAYAFLLCLTVFGYLNRLSELGQRHDLALEKNAAGWILSQYGSSMLVFMAFFSLVSALAVFSYMHFQKNTAMVHALPVTRKCLFITNYLSGLALVILPLLLSGAVLVSGELAMGVVYMNYSLVWIAVSLAVSILLYSFAVFAGMFTGHMAAHAIFYVIFNLLASFLMSMLSLIFACFLYGYSYRSDYITPLSPFIYVPKMYTDFGQNIGNAYVVIAYILAAIAFSAGACLIYMKRKMETAGDVISIRAVKPVFRFSVAFCSAILLGTFVRALLNIGNEFLPYLASCLAGGFIGYYVSEMLLRKTFRVFKKVKGFLGFAGVLTLLLLSVRFDFFGYSAYVPDASQVEAVYIGSNFNELERVALDPESYDPDKDGYFAGGPDYASNPPSSLDDTQVTELRRQAGILVSPEAIGKTLALHRYITDNVAALGPSSPAYKRGVAYTNPENFYYMNVAVAYRLKSGRITERVYYLPYPIGSGDGLETRMKDLLSSGEIRANCNPLLNVRPEDLDFISVSLTGTDNRTKSMTYDDTGAILDALRRDGSNLDPINIFTYVRKANPLNIEVTINFKKPTPQFFTSVSGFTWRDDKTWVITLMNDNKNTLDYLVNSGVISRGDIVALEVKY